MDGVERLHGADIGDRLCEHHEVPAPAMAVGRDCPAATWFDLKGSFRIAN
jgi:hypothetical protein